MPPQSSPEPTHARNGSTDGLGDGASADRSEASVSTEVERDRAPRPSIGTTAGHLVRGGLIGVAETIPGVSGGTIALVTGIYSRLIASGKHLTDIPKALLTRGDWRDPARRVDWWLLLPVGLGAVLVVFSIAGLMESFVTDQPVHSKAIFMGMIAVSVVIPFLEVERGALDARAAKVRAGITFVVAAVLAFTLTSLPRSEMTTPPLWLVFGAAAIAVCALVLPGVSGSFFLLVIGLYAPTLAAVDARDVTYLAVFGAGILVGFVSFVRVLEWLLENHHTWAMIAASGLLLGSLRALWPWQAEDGAVQPVGSEWPTALAFFVVGAVLVGIVAVAQRRLYADDAHASEVERDSHR